MEKLKNIFLYIVLWFVISTILLAFWDQTGGEITRMPIYLWAISFILPYYILFRKKSKKKDKEINHNINDKEINQNINSSEKFSLLSYSQGLIMLIIIAFIFFVLYHISSSVKINENNNSITPQNERVEMERLSYSNDSLYFSRDMKPFTGRFYYQTIGWRKLSEIRNTAFKRLHLELAKKCFQYQNIELEGIANKGKIESIFYTHDGIKCGKNNEEYVSKNFIYEDNIGFVLHGEYQETIRDLYSPKIQTNANYYKGFLDKSFTSHFIKTNTNSVFQLRTKATYDKGVLISSKCWDINGDEIECEYL